MKLFQGIIKLLAVLSFGLSGGLLAIIFISANFDLTPFLIRLTVLSAIAVAGSLVGRLLFRKIPNLILVFLMATMNLLAILAIDIFYDGEFRFEFLQQDLRFQIPSASDFAQFGYMLILSIPVSIAFRRRKVKKKAARVPVWQSIRSSINKKSKSIQYKLNPKNWQIFQKKPVVQAKQSNHAAASNQKLHIPIKNTPLARIKRPAVKSSPVKTRKKVRIPGKLFGSAINDVKLVGDEEHVCPYCLEEVRRDDPAGVVVCKECGTWHHQDCWNLTGSCGVAHRNEL